MRSKVQKQNQPQAKPGVSVGDHVYFDHPAGPKTGRVVACGKHGVTLDCEGQPHKVHWNKVLGHKKRQPQRFNVIDEGEDGLIVEDQTGKRRYLHIPPESRAEKMVAKSFNGGQRLMLFAKAEPVKNRPGLSLKDITDKAGHQTKRWVRTIKDQPESKDYQKEKPEEERGSKMGYGTHNLEAGDRVSFKTNDFSGEGEIVGKPGADGAHVKDDKGEVHQVLWAQVTGHKSGAQKPEVENEVKGHQDSIPPDEFNAAEYAAEHDDANVTPEDILKHFPPDTKDKIKDVQQRLKSVEETIQKYKKGENYQSERQAVHRKIYQHFLSNEAIDAATPADGEKPTFTILGGRGGSGKSWFSGKVYDPKKAIVLDADEIKGMLPEYEGWNAAEVHEESSDIMNTILTTARKMGLNVVLDGTLATKKSALKKVTAFKDDGYQIEAHYMHLPRQEAAKRAVSRFLGKTNRYVPVDVVLANRENEANFDDVRKLADKWSFRDNNVAQGQEPKLISESHPSEDQKDNSDEKGLTKSYGRAMIVLWSQK